MKILSKLGQSLYNIGRKSGSSEEVLACEDILVYPKLVTFLGGIANCSKSRHVITVAVRIEMVSFSFGEILADQMSSCTEYSDPGKKSSSFTSL